MCILPPTFTSPFAGVPCVKSPLAEWRALESRPKQLYYKCIEQDRGLFALHISPLWLAVWMGMWMVLISMCCTSTCWIVRHRRTEQMRLRTERFAGRAFGRTDASVLLVHAELVRRRELERQHAIEATERDREASLQALPTRSWREEGKGREQEECCLCMETFSEDEVIRMLPCEHFFHQECIDRWFQSKAYMQRTCPLCKRDPLEGCAPNISGSSAGVSTGVGSGSSGSSDGGNVTAPGGTVSDGIELEGSRLYAAEAAANAPSANHEQSRELMPAPTNDDESTQRAASGAHVVHEGLQVAIQP